MCYVGQLCTMIRTQMWAVLTVLWIKFRHTGPPLTVRIDLFVFICVFCFILYMCTSIVRTVGWTWWDWSLVLKTKLPSVLWHVGWVIWPVKPVPNMTCNVFGGTLNLGQLNSSGIAFICALCRPLLRKSFHTMNEWRKPVKFIAKINLANFLTNNVIYYIRQKRKTICKVKIRQSTAYTEYLRDPAVGRDSFREQLKTFLFATY